MFKPLLHLIKRAEQENEKKTLIRTQKFLVYKMWTSLTSSYVVCIARDHFYFFIHIFVSLSLFIFVVRVHYHLTSTIVAFAITLFEC